VPVIAIPIPPVGVAAPACGDQTTVAPVATQVFGFPALERQRAAVRPFGQNAVLDWTFMTATGLPVDLSVCLTAGATVRLQLQEAITGGSGALAFAGTAVNPNIGAVQVPIDLATLGAPGIYRAEIGLVDTTGGLIFSNTLTLVVAESLFQPVAGAWGPPSIMELRLMLRDSSPVEKRLIDTVTFDDAEIALALKMPVQYFNEINPPLDQVFNSTNFPSRYHWCRGAAAQLFFMVAEYYRANALQYQAGGLAVDDLNKEQPYTAAGDRYWTEFKDWVRATKIAMNQAACWGSVPSPYAFGNGWFGGF
jgi:hypothetical protein